MNAEKRKVGDTTIVDGPGNGSRLRGELRETKSVLYSPHPHVTVFISPTVIHCCDISPSYK
jgi:hypothetical protein